jgi:AcrR family transcriptional regulator
VITSHTTLIPVKYVRQVWSKQLAEGTLTRRERVRAATKTEICHTARRLLVEQGQDAVSLRAIAREMGMTAPGLYRYFGSREELLRHVCAEMFRELSAGIRQAIDEADPPAATRGQVSRAGTRARLTRKMVAACREFRRWSLANKDEFALLFGVPLPDMSYDGSNDVAEQCAMEFAGTFYALFVELWDQSPFPIPDGEAMDPVLRAQLARFSAKFGTVAPDGAMLVFLQCWVLLYGALAMELFGHLNFALDDPSPMFEYTLHDLAAKVGLEYPPAD